MFGKNKLSLRFGFLCQGLISLMQKSRIKTQQCAASVQIYAISAFSVEKEG